ncbi:hypothetical protein OsJ_27956 [Oryza sativa Japonica Group]|uniref:Uncharacterized protein n=1 Tax=Oryza sativa subsp. japonica TaxID=39947 RepID=B9G1U2_ORYSJ|nr:hypothetical protein OsJ_27956 [Oryza sativa Japonica Group]
MTGQAIQLHHPRSQQGLLITRRMIGQATHLRRLRSRNHHSGTSSGTHSHRWTALRIRDLGVAMTMWSPTMNWHDYSV